MQQNSIGFFGLRWQIANATQNITLNSPTWTPLSNSSCYDNVTDHVPYQTWGPIGNDYSSRYRAQVYFQSEAVIPHLGIFSGPIQVNICSQFIAATSAPSGGIPTLDLAIYPSDTYTFLASGENPSPEVVAFYITPIIQGNLSSSGTFSPPDFPPFAFTTQCTTTLNTPRSFSIFQFTAFNTSYYVDTTFDSDFDTAVSIYSGNFDSSNLPDPCGTNFIAAGDCGDGGPVFFSTEIGSQYTAIISPFDTNIPSGSFGLVVSTGIQLGVLFPQNNTSTYSAVNDVAGKAFVVVWAIGASLMGLVIVAVVGFALGCKNKKRKQDQENQIELIPVNQ